MGFAIGAEGERLTVSPADESELMPDAEGAERGFENLRGASEASAFEIHERECRRGPGAEVEVEAAGVIVGPGLVETNQAGKSAGVAERGGDDEEGEIRERGVEAGGGESVILAVEEDERSVWSGFELGPRVAGELVEMTFVTGGVDKLVQSRGGRELAEAGGAPPVVLADGVEPERGVFDGESAISPGFGGEREGGRKGEKKGETEAIHRNGERVPRKNCAGKFKSPGPFYGLTPDKIRV